MLIGHSAKVLLEGEMLGGGIFLVNPINIILCRIAVKKCCLNQGYTFSLLINVGKCSFRSIDLPSWQKVGALKLFSEIGIATS